MLLVDCCCAVGVTPRTQSPPIDLHPSPAWSLACVVPVGHGDMILNLWTKLCLNLVPVHPHLLHDVDSFATGAGGRGKPASSGPAVPAAGGRRATVGAVAAGANGPPRSGAVPRAGEAAAAVGSPKEPEAVIDTANVTRKKAQLPQQEQLEHPTPVGGSWLKNRYIVNNYILLESLGTGSYAEVRLAKEKTSNKLYAVKIMNKDFLKRKQVGKEETFMDSIKREIAIMKEVRHPNVLQLYEVMDDPKVNKLYLVLEYCKKGDLMNILNGDTRAATCDPMNDTDVWYIMRQIVQGLSFLHQHNIIHGDIKPQNLLVGSDNVAKIADFGISKFVQGSGQQLQEQAGTPTFMSPELCCGKCYSGQLADVWALGATMYMIRCGKPPFMANQVMALYEKIQNDPLDFPPEVSMSAGLRRILRAMMEKEPAKRTALDQVVSDRWIQQGDCGYARTAAAGNTPTTTTAPTSSTNTTIPSTAAATPPLYGGLSLHTAFSGGNAIGSSGGSGGSGGVGAPPRNGVGPGLRPPPTVSILPSTEQGNRTIKVSYDEVPRSINQNATTGGYHGPGSAGGCGARGSLLVQQQQRTLAASSTTLPILQGTTAAGAPHALAGVSGGGSPSPLASPLGVGTGVGEGRQEGGGGGGGTKRESGIGRGDLSETEESWKCRSFQKIKEKNDGDPRFRGGTATSTVAPNSAEAAAATAAATVGATPAPLCSSSTAAAHHHQNRQQQKQQQHASGQGGRDTATRTRSDSFSGDGSESDCYSSENDPDTVYEQEGSDGGTPTASPRFAGVVPASPSSPSSRAANASEAASRQKAVPPVGQPRGGISPRGESVGNTGADGGTRVGVSMQQQESGRCASARRRSSSERFAAVMDTLAAQPSKESRGPEGASSRREGPSGGSNSGDWSPTYSGSSCPPRDLSLRGVRVTSSPSAAAGRLSSSAAAAAMPGECLCNRRLGLVAASSQRQGKRASQEDRTTVCADLETALAGKVERAYRYQHYALFGVFDGHNGQMCSEALHAGLHVAVAKQPVFHQALDKALIQAFNGFDKDLRVRQEQEGDTSGSTALLVVFDGNSRTLLVANAGDSRCVSSSRAGVATRLSSDHRLSRPDELERVLTNGGFVTNNRINGVLAVSRSFGDVQHKDGTSPGLIATPELRSERVTSSAPSSGDGGGSGGLLEFVILATDGLWDVVEDQEAVNFVRLHLFENDGDLSGAARGLTKLALDQGSVDNVSAVLVWLDEDTDEVVQQQQQPPPQHQIFLQQQGQYHRPHFKQHVAPD